jgi:hypothetical protein
MAFESAVTEGFDHLALPPGVDHGLEGMGDGLFGEGEVLVGLEEFEFEESGKGMGLSDQSGGATVGELLAQVRADEFEIEASGAAFGDGLVSGGEGGGVAFEGKLFLVLAQGEQGLESEPEGFHELVAGEVAAEREARA